MTESEKRQIDRLRQTGMGYKRIAATLGLPVNGVKSYCRRRSASALLVDQAAKVCLNCGEELTQSPHRKEKKFCSDRCRMRWWNSHQDMVIRKAYYTCTCAFCGKQFESYGKEHRIYCSRDCYAKARRKEVGVDG